MARRILVLEGDELLRKKSKPVTEFDDRLHILLDDMKETLKAENGAGLAGVQVGALKRVFVMNLDESGYVEFVNPEIVYQSKRKSVAYEGCLSVPEKTGKVERPVKVEVKFCDRFGKEHKQSFSGFEARCVCHESDHLDGILYVDKVVDGVLKSVNDEKKKAKK